MTFHQSLTLSLCTSVYPSFYHPLLPIVPPSFPPPTHQLNYSPILSTTHPSIHPPTHPASQPARNLFVRYPPWNPSIHPKTHPFRNLTLSKSIQPPRYPPRDPPIHLNRKHNINLPFIRTNLEVGRNINSRKPLFQ